MKGRTVIFTVGNPCAGKTTLADMMSEYMGYHKMTVDTAILDLLKMLKDCQLLKDIRDILYEGKPTDDNLIINIINRRITMEDLINENIVIDGFPYTLSQANLLPDTLVPDIIFVAQCDIKTRVKRCLDQKDFDGIPEVVHERNTQLESHFMDIMQSFKERQFDIRYFDMTKSRWFIKDQIFELLQNRKKAEMNFSRCLSLDKPCLLNNFTPRKLLKLLKEYSKLKCSLLMYSPVCLKTSFLFKNNKCIDNSWNNYIVYTPYNEEKEKKRKEEEEKEKQDLEDIIRRGRERRRREKREKLEREKKEKEEREKKEKEEKERKEKEEKERKEKEEKERKEFPRSSKRIFHYKSFKRNIDKKETEENAENKENTENIENKGYYSTKDLERVKKREIPKSRLFHRREPETHEPEIKKNTANKEQKLEEEEEVEEDDSKYKHRNKNDTNKIEEPKTEIKKEEKEDHILSFKERWKFRRPEAKKTLGKIIKEETSSTSHLSNNNNEQTNNNSNEENSNTNTHDNNSHKSNINNNENNNHENNKNNNAFVNPVQKIPGMSENLLNHINRRISNIISKCSIPLMNVEDYILYKKIGEGSYGVIFSVINKKDKKQYALKKIISNKLKQIGEFTKEFELVHSCEHENIMKIYNFCIRILDPTTYALYVLMELSEGDWDKEIKKKLKQRKNYSEKELINILYQLTCALLYIQEKYHISHRDIKPQNVLVFPDGKYKLADFGEAKEAKVSRQINTLRGTELYMSPALYDGLKNERNDVSHNPFKSDVFSLGFCFLYASALNFNLLYEVRDILDSRTINVILHKFLNKFYSEKLIQLLASMLEIDESKRYDFATIKSYIEENYKEMVDKVN